MKSIKSSLYNLYVDHQLKKFGLYDLYCMFRNHPAGTWIIGANDAVNLYRIINKYQPRNILDIGTGIGASASLAAHISNVPVTTIDQHIGCLKVARELIPKSMNVKILQSDLEIYSLKGLEPRLFVRHRDLPKGEFDFVIFDNQDSMIRDGKIVPIDECVDFMRIDFKVGGMMYIDGCKPIQKLIKRFFSKHFKLVEKGKGNSYWLVECIKSPDELLIYDTKQKTIGSKGYLV